MVRVLDVTVRLASIVMCLAVAGAAVQYVVTARGTPVTDPPLSGATIDSVDSLNPDGGTLILGLSTACRFCTDSMPFYRNLAALDDVRAGRLKLSVLSFQPADEMRRYLDHHALDVSTIVEVQDVGIPVSRTPTILLVDQYGTVLDAWVGRLNADGQREVQAAAGLLARSLS